MSNFLFRTIIKIIYGELRPMKPEVEAVVKELIFYTFSFGAFFGAIVILLIVIIKMYGF